MGKNRAKKLASIVIGASLIAGGASFFGCSNVESNEEKSKYATQLANELQFKFQFEFPEYVSFQDVVYKQTKRNDENILGITIDGKQKVRDTYSWQDYDLKMEYLLDDELYQEFKLADKTDISHMYEMTSLLIENLNPTFLKTGDVVVYEIKTQSDDISYENEK